MGCADVEIVTVPVVILAHLTFIIGFFISSTIDHDDFAYNLTIPFEHTLYPIIACFLSGMIRTFTKVSFIMRLPEVLTVLELHLSSI